MDFSFSEIPFIYPRICVSFRNGIKQFNKNTFFDLCYTDPIKVN